MSTSRYASFGKRFVAIFSDGILLQLLFFIAFGQALSQIDNPKAILYYVFTTLFAWAYFASMESSLIQGTFGKRLLGIIVTDIDGNKISFARATARYFSKSFFVLIWIVAGLIAVMAASTENQNSPYLVLAGLLFIIGLLILFIGYLMAAFTPQKQALHDIIARCLVVNGSGQSVTIPWKPLIGLAIAAILAGRVIAQIPGGDKAITPPPDLDSTITPSSSPTPTNITSSDCASKTNNIFGLELTEANTDINGNWKLEFAGGVIQHVGYLSMKDSSGIMVVQLPNDQGGTETIRQNMKLCSSAKGLVLLGENPIDVDTNQTSPTYAPDNFIIARGVNGEIFRNYSRHSNNNVVESPVERKFLGYSSIGIEMAELNSEVRVQAVENNSNAQKAGLQPGDIILSIDGKQVNRVSEVQELIKSSLLDSTLNFEIDRNGQNNSLSVTAGCCVPPEQP
ncbi:RDD family protein [Nostoc favosum]|uniref:RDD family protein n=1 Tax=Nostoc favosum CHAB5714 TaxID=2780399 RepID=A0ABS8I9M0_9NOSO|nr:RDD family protein [Nostoc favosum]MCC5600389.1 RDD family protein [Nostoc favosum CHAB5714]